MNHSWPPLCHISFTLKEVESVIAAVKAILTIAEDTSPIEAAELRDVLGKLLEAAAKAPPKAK